MASAIRFQVLYVLRFLSIARRHIVNFAVTVHLSAAWTTQQVVDVFPGSAAPKYLLRDRTVVAVPEVGGLHHRHECRAAHPTHRMSFHRFAAPQRLRRQTDLQTSAIGPVGQRSPPPNRRWRPFLNTGSRSIPDTTGTDGFSGTTTQAFAK